MMKLYLLFHLFSALAFAMSGKAIDLEWLKQNSALIVHAKLLQSYSEFRGSHIWTVYRFAVVDEISGNAPREIEVEQPGGSTKDYTTVVAGTKDYSQAEAHLLFLWPSPTGYQSLGFMQGSLDLVTVNDTVLVPQVPQQSTVVQDTAIRFNLMKTSAVQARHHLSQFLRSRRLQDLKEYLKSP